MKRDPPDTGLRAFLYVSLPRQAPDLVILDIMRAAERVNRRLEISGMLLYGPGCYAQFVEGPEDGVHRVRRRIEDDDRHRILWITAWPVDRRSIGAALPMGYVSEREFARHRPRAQPALSSIARPAPEHMEDLRQSLTAAALDKYPSAARGA